MASMHSRSLDVQRLRSSEYSFLATRVFQRLSRNSVVTIVDSLGLEALTRRCSAGTVQSPGAIHCMGQWSA